MTFLHNPKCKKVTNDSVIIKKFIKSTQGRHLVVKVEKWSKFEKNWKTKVQISWGNTSTSQVYNTKYK